MTLLLSEIRDLAFRFVPARAADKRLYESGARSWWPSHEIGHFLVATASECRRSYFGLVTKTTQSAKARYVRVRELAATSISQRLLIRSGHHGIAEDELAYSNEEMLDYGKSLSGRFAVTKLLRAWRATRLPAWSGALETLLMWKAHAVDTPFYASVARATPRRSNKFTETLMYVLEEDDRRKLAARVRPVLRRAKKPMTLEQIAVAVDRAANETYEALSINLHGFYEMRNKKFRWL